MCKGKKKIKMARVRLRTPRQKSGEPVRSATESPRLVTRHGPPGRGRVQGPRHSALFVGFREGPTREKGEGTAGPPCSPRQGRPSSSGYPPFHPRGCLFSSLFSTRPDTGTRGGRVDSQPGSRLRNGPGRTEHARNEPGVPVRGRGVRGREGMSPAPASLRHMLLW